MYATANRLQPTLASSGSTDTAAGSVRWQVRTAFVSDAHLGSRGCRAAELLEFLESVRMEQLVIVGDLTDFWGLRSSCYWPTAHNAVVRAPPLEIAA